MRIKPGLFVILCFVSLAFTYGQSAIDYKHKTLQKALQKAGITNMSLLEELVLPDSANNSTRIQGKYFQSAYNNAIPSTYLYVGRVNSCRANGCSSTNRESLENNSEYFDYFILFDAAKTVQAVNVFNYQATHGQEITARGWLKQFIGHSASKQLQVDKNIDAISGATISVYAITSDIEMKTEILQNYF